MCFSTSTEDELKESAPLFAKKKAIILLQSPNDWSESTYNDLVQNVTSGLQHLDVSTESILLIPGNVQGENFIELSPRTPWYTNATLIAALDEVFS
ncbi:hypothetical protein CC86DRAFT_368992 [Ophiobolus disseminans]|uniref:Uncharacterized protein n=1 Tax=Ophiobolus disseminans TaxID=1469910 RepID=A0A6A7A7U4_9PLEO|nr:hypothetical protein CC86DRAFT_368992 [Ophiobolus disseminans]